MDPRDSDNNDHMETDPPAQIEIRDLDVLIHSATSESSLDISPSSAPTPSERTGMRRTRVDDDHDDERDRRHPSQRVASSFPPSPSSSSSSSSSALPAAAATSTAAPSEAGPFPGLATGPVRFFQHIPPLTSPSSPHVHWPTAAASSEPRSTTSTDGAAPSFNQPSSSGPNSDSAATRPPRPNIVHQYLGGFAISIDVNGARTTIPLPGPASLASNAARTNPDTNAMHADSGPSDENPAAEQSHQQPQPQPQPQQQQRRSSADGGPPLPNNNSIADFLRHLSILTAFSMGGAGLFDRDGEDPERAKKLVDGLEDVPVGLVKRLERVGKVSGISDESSGVDGTGLGDGGCAICWERLLTREREETQTADDGAEGSSAAPPATTSDSHTTEKSEGADLKDDDETATGDYKRIVSLPCAHVFHAKCLIPWFSKPKQTTCPICRFNIDPENLTYTSGAQRRAAARREREQERARARAEGRADNEEHDEEEEDRNGDDGLGFGGDIPLFGATPIVVPLGGGRRQQQQQQPPADASQNGAQEQPAAEDADADAPAEDDVPRAGDHPHEHRLHDIVTIGVDMYIGRGPPPPFAMRGGANVFQFPFPGGADGPPANAGHPPSANANAHDADGAGAGASQPPPRPPSANAGEGNAQAGERGHGGEGRSTTFAIPLGQGFGRIIGETFSRIFSGGHHRAGENNGNNREQQGPPAAAAAANDGSGSAEQQSQGAARGSMPMPGGVGIGVGGGGAPRPFSFPATGGGGVGGGAPQQNGGQQQGGGGDVPRMFETMIPLLDILFGPRTPGQGLGEGQDVEEAGPQQPPPAAAQPGQPQAQAQQANPPTTGFGWTFIAGPAGAPPTFVSGSQLPRPASGQRQRQEPPASRKVWAPPPAPGLSLRQRVERKEQEAGLRCCDVSCGVGPSDEDPWVDVGMEGLKQVRIRRGVGEGGVRSVDSGVVVGGDNDPVEYHEEAVCGHTFHSSCLVISERVALRGAEVVSVLGGKEVEVSCPVCRGVGRVSREEWESGVRVLG